MIEIKLLEKPNANIKSSGYWKWLPIKFEADGPTIRKLLENASKKEKMDICGYTDDGNCYNMFGFLVISHVSRNIDSTDKENVETENVGMFDNSTHISSKTLREDQYLRYLAMQSADDLKNIRLEYDHIEYDEKIGGKVILLSETMEYHITGTWEKDGRPSYIGCILTERYGMCGSDLKEDLLTLKGWASVLNDIQYYESLIKLENE